MQEMTPTAWALRPLKRYAQFSGRAPRAEYWWFYLFSFIADRILSFVDSRVFSSDEGWLAGALSLAILLPSIAVTVRRLHDTGRTGWWLLAMVILIAIPVAMFTAGLIDDSFKGRWAVPAIAFIVAAAILAVALFVFMILPGTEEPNRYGPDPYGPNDLEEVFA